MLSPHGIQTSAPGRLGAFSAISSGHWRNQAWPMLSSSAPSALPISRKSPVHVPTLQLAKTGPRRWARDFSGSCVNPPVPKTTPFFARIASCSLVLDLNPDELAAAVLEDADNAVLSEQRDAVFVGPGLHLDRNRS